MSFNVILGRPVGHDENIFCYFHCKVQSFLF